jgi:hypothetical protein
MQFYILSYMHGRNKHNLLLSVKFHNFCLGLYNKQNITRWLEDMTLSSRVKNNILLTRYASS